VIDFYEMRLVLEPYLVQRIAGQLSTDQAESLHAIIADQKQAAVEKDTLTYHQLDLRFHELLAEFHGNREMVRALGQMRDKMYRLSRRLHRTHPERLTINAEQHQRIVEAVCGGKRQDASEAMQSHLIWGRDFTLDPEGRIS
jgi:DNA-binding GntR family transcriptional regulator